MTLKEFQKLKVGNIIRNHAQQEFVVIHVVRDPNGNALFAGTAPAINSRDAVDWAVVSQIGTELYVDGTAIKSRPVE